MRGPLTHCVTEDRKNRLRHIGDAQLELHRAIAETRDVARGAASRPWQRSPAVFDAAVVGIAAVAAAALAFKPSPKDTLLEQAMVRAGLLLPDDKVLLQSERSGAVSPDGMQVVVWLVQKDGTTPPSLYFSVVSVDNTGFAAGDCMRRTLPGPAA